MAVSNTQLFNWYRRYKVTAQNMGDFQEALTELTRGFGETSFGATVLEGLDISAVSGSLMGVQAGAALGATGYLGVLGSSGTLDCSAAVSGSLPIRSLVVLRPNIVDANLITSPTNPNTQVYLNELQEAELVLIPGTPSATPAYPAKGSADTILCGIIAPGSNTTLASSMFDFEVRETIGENSLIAQNQGHWDDRLRPYRIDYETLGIKPSQNIGSRPTGLTYAGKMTHSAYPLTGGSFTAADSQYNFATGAISGGDGTTSSFTPTTPTAGNSVLCVVTLTPSDTLNFNYGTQGTLAQCLAAIQNATTGGAGGMPSHDGNVPLAIVLVTSVSGSLSDIRVFDARPRVTPLPQHISEAPSGSINGSNSSFTLSQTPVPNSVKLFLDGLYQRPGTDYTISGNTITMSTAPTTSQTMDAAYQY